MKIIDYLNIVAIIINILIVLVILASYKKGNKGYCLATPSNKIFSFLSTRKGEYLLLFFVLLTATLLRFVNLSALPSGLYHDEACVGYEAYSIANFGVDRNGYSYPVYPMGYGSGGSSPLLIYLNVISTSLFGSNVSVLRGTVAFFNVISVFLFYLLLKRLLGQRTALIGAVIYSIMPWQIILSRWSLDSNIMPFLILSAAVLFLKAIDSGRTIHFCIAAAFCGLCMYGYGSANIYVPLFIVLMCISCLIHRKLSVKQLILSAVSFFIVFLPLFVVYAISYLGFPSISLGIISFPKAITMRSAFISLDSTFPKTIISNFIYLLKMMTIGNPEEAILNFIPGFATLFKFTIPITFLGLGVSIYNIIKKRKESFSFEIIILWLLVAAIILSLIISPDINRNVCLFTPLIYYFVYGLKLIWNHSKKLATISIVLLLAAEILFIHTYFYEYNDMSSYMYMPGYGEACEYSDEICEDGQVIYSTHQNVSAPFILALYYTKTSPVVFHDTVVYEDSNAEFLMAKSFGHFAFYYPDEITIKIENNEAINAADLSGNIYIISHNEESSFDTSSCEITEFGNYAVVSSK